MATGTTRVRYAVVGAGNIAQVAVLPAFRHARENSELVAIVSSDPEKRDALSKHYDVEHVGDYDQYEDVLKRAAAEAVFIATPNTHHRDLAERAARIGVHVLCEKPMAPTVADCEAMIATCREHGVKLMVAYRLHFEEANLRAIEIVNSGEIGQPKIFTSVFSQVVRPGDIRTRDEVAGGALLDMGVYPINAARYLFRDEPIEVLASRTYGAAPNFDGVDEAMTAILRFPGDRVAQFTVSLAAASVSSYRMLGTEGDLHVEPAYDYAQGLAHRLTIHGKTREETFRKRDQFAAELIFFSRCILTGEEPEPSGEEGLADIRVVEAIVQAAKTGAAVQLPPFRRAQRPDMSQEIHKRPVRQPETINAPAPSLK